MKSYEILNRASAFLVRSSSEKFENKFHVVTSSHVVAPWKYPKYYPDEWLKYVNEDHSYCTIEIRQADGTFITQHDLHCIAYHHPTKDLAVMHLSDEDGQLVHINGLGYTTCDLATEKDLLDYGNVKIFLKFNWMYY
jgi:hypothetical protein